jgi:hypothetical protein
MRFSQPFEVQSVDLFLQWRDPAMFTFSVKFRAGCIGASAPMRLAEILIAKVKAAFFLVDKKMQTTIYSV